METFDNEILENDYNDIFSNLINPSEGYIHYVISYDSKNSELLDVKLEVLDRSFNVVYKKSLNEFIKPDYANLTEPNVVASENPSSSTENMRSILGIKKGIRPSLKEIEEEA